MLGVHKRRHAAALLRFGNHVEGYGRLPTRFGPENLNHPATRKSAHTQRRVKRNRPRGDHLDGDERVLGPQAHDRALAELLFDLAQGHVNGLAALTAFLRHRRILSALRLGTAL